MRHVCLLGLTLLAVACGTNDPSGTLMLQPDTFSIIVGGSTFVTAYLNDGTAVGSAGVKPVDVSWSASPDGIIMLTPVNGIQKVTGVSPGQVVVTASGFDQTAMVGFTVMSP